MSVPPELIEEAFDATGLPVRSASLPAPLVPPRYNVAPTQDVVIVKRAAPDAAKPRQMELARWGLAGAAKMINARKETVFEKQPFANAVRLRRCLVPADGFFEWKKLGTGRGALKQALRIRVKDELLFAMAGIFGKWKNPAGEWVETFSILTTSANELVAPIHDRMPVILARENWDLWLDPSIRDREPLEHLLAPFPAERMIAEPVSSRVNDVNHDDPACLEIVDPLPVPEENEPPKKRQLGFEF